MEIQNQTNTSETQTQPLDTVEQGVTNNTEETKAITIVEESDQSNSESTSSVNDTETINEHNSNVTTISSVITNSDLSKRHQSNIDPVKERRRENNKPTKMKKDTTPKSVDVTRLLNLKDVIAENHMKQSSDKKPNTFGKFTPKDIKSNILIVKESEDGKTHFNVSFNGKTKLGQTLDIYHFSPMNIPELGSFNSIGGLQHYLMSNPYDERFRVAAGRNARELGKSVPARPIKGLKNILAEASWYKIIQNENLMNMFLETDLPFYAYYVKEGNVVMTALNNWYTRVLEEIRKTIKLNDSNLKQCIADGKNPESLEIQYPNFEFLDQTRNRKK